MRWGTFDTSITTSQKLLRCFCVSDLIIVVQSERFYAALKGNGALCRLVLLPLESHGYSGRESVMHCLWEMDRWLQTHCVNAVGSTSGPSSQTDAAEAKLTLSSSGAGGGSAPECAPIARTFTCGFGPLSSL